MILEKLNNSGAGVCLLCAEQKYLYEFNKINAGISYDVGFARALASALRFFFGFCRHSVVVVAWSASALASLVCVGVRLLLGLRFGYCLVAVCVGGVSLCLSCRLWLLGLCRRVEVTSACFAACVGVGCCVRQPRCGRRCLVSVSFLCPCQRRLRFVSAAAHSLIISLRFFSFCLLTLCPRSVISWFEVVVCVGVGIGVGLLRRLSLRRFCSNVGGCLC